MEKEEDGEGLKEAVLVSLQTLRHRLTQELSQTSISHQLQVPVFRSNRTQGKEEATENCCLGESSVGIKRKVDGEDCKMSGTKVKHRAGDADLAVGSQRKQEKYNTDVDNMLLVCKVHQTASTRAEPDPDPELPAYDTTVQRDILLPKGVNIKLVGGWVSHTLSKLLKHVAYSWSSSLSSTTGDNDILNSASEDEVILSSALLDYTWQKLNTGEPPKVCC